MTLSNNLAVNHYNSSGRAGDQAAASSRLHVVQSLILYPPDSFGGTEQYVQALAQDLQHLNVDVTVTATAAHEYRYLHEGVPVYRYPSTLKPSRSEMRGKQPPLHFEVFASWLREAQVDVLHMHAFTRAIGLYHAEQCKALGIPLVFTVHLPGITCARGTMLHEGRRVCDGKIIVQRCAGCQLQAAGLPALPARVAAVMPPAIARRAVDWPGRMGTLLGMPALIAERTQRLQGLFELADRIVVVAGWLYEVLRRNGVPAEKLLLSRHGLAPQQMTGKHRRERRPERALTVGFIGRFNPIKGAHVLISAMMRLPQHVPVRLRIYGICNDRMEERYMAELQSQAASDGRMSFPGAITAANRAQVFDELDVLAVPSQWLETGPLVALEAFAAGIPVVGSAHGGLTELITPEVNGLLLPPDQPAAWTRALQRLASEDGLLARLSDGVPAVRSSAIVAAEMLDLYRQLRPVASL